MGTANFANPYAARDVAEGIRKYMEQYQVENVQELIGGVRKAIEFER